MCRSGLNPALLNFGIGDIIKLILMGDLGVKQ